MGRLTAALCAAALLWAVPATAGPLDRWSAYIADASARFGIPENWIGRVMRAESGGRTRLDGHPIESSAGAMGLMQLMPGTWRDMRAANGLGADPHDPRDNILAGTAYLRALYDRFGYPGLFAAYNAGPARYAEHLATGRQLPRETIAYLGDVAGTGAAAPAARRGPVPAALFAVRASQPPPDAGPASLFVLLRTAAAQ
jgi:soluble lytic murein transglycosylase-like protein